MFDVNKYHVSKCQFFRCLMFRLDGFTIAEIDDNKTTVEEACKSKRDHDSKCILWLWQHFESRRRSSESFFFFFPDEIRQCYTRNVYILQAFFIPQSENFLSIADETPRCRGTRPTWEFPYTKSKEIGHCKLIRPSSFNFLGNQTKHRFPLLVFNFLKDPSETA